MYKLFLASESPRRRQLLQDAGFVFTTVSAKVSETPDKNLNINAQILDIARRKNEAVVPGLRSSEKQDFIVLSADTEVVLDQRTLGKPSDKDDAYRILRLLSGKSHDVKTGVHIFESSADHCFSQIETTKVHFKVLSDQEIWNYIETGEPMDKAGAYGIQGIGSKLVENYVGSFDNVIGLPMKLVREGFEQLRVRV